MKKIKKWKERTKAEKAKTIIYWILFAIFVTGTVFSLVYSSYIFGETSYFYLNAEYIPNTFFRWCFTSIPSVIRSIQIIVIGIVLDHVLRLAMRLTIAHSKKGITIMQILASFLKWAIAIVAILLILYNEGKIYIERAR